MGFFLIEIQLWKIGNSLAAPRFHLIEQPNEWTKMVKLSGELSETDRTKLSYWTKYVEIAKKDSEFLKVFSPHKPSKDHWTSLRCGTSEYHLALLISTQRRRIGIEFYVPHNKEIGRKAIAMKHVFEERLGLEAIPFDAKKASGLRFYKDGCDLKGKPDMWPAFIADQMRWALEINKVILELGL